MGRKQLSVISGFLDTRHNSTLKCINAKVNDINPITNLKALLLLLLVRVHLILIMFTEICENRLNFHLFSLT